MKKIMLCAILALCLGLPRQSEAQYLQTDPFNFQALNQNMWGGSGNPTILDYQHFLGLSWNESYTLGSIIGSAHTTIIPHGCINYLFGEYCWDDVTADTRTGLAITAYTDGNIGLNVGAKINAGSVDVTVPGQATVSTGSLDGHVPGTEFTIQTGAVIDPSATMHTQFPTVEAYADFVFDVRAGASIEACLIGAGCTSTGGNIVDVNTTYELAALNRDGDGQVRILGSPVDLSGTIAGVVDYSLAIPNLQTDASAPSPDLQSSGEAQFLDLSVNVPALIADFIYPGAGYIFSGSFYGLTYTTFGADLGPEFSVGQEFTFESTPMVTLDFSEPVSQLIYLPGIGDIRTAAQTEWAVPLGASPNFIFPDAMALDVTPTYWLQNSLNVDTDLLARLGLDLTVLELQTPLGNIGPVYSDHFATSPLSIGLDDRDISLAFNSYQGSTFELSAVPEPSTWLLLGSGLLLLGVFGWRKMV